MLERELAVKFPSQLLGLQGAEMRAETVRKLRETNGKNGNILCFVTFQ